MNQPARLPLEKYEFSWAAWRANFLRIALIASAFFGLLALVATLLNPSEVMAVKIIYTGMFFFLLFLIFIRIPYILKAGIFLFIVYLLGISNLTETGIWGDTRLYFLTFIVMADLLVSVQMGWYALGASLAPIAIAGWMTMTGQLVPSVTGIPTGNVSDWISGSAVLLLLAAVINSALQMLYRELDRAQGGIQESIQALTTERTHLEARVDERTEALARRTRQLRTAVEIGHTAASMRDLENLLPHTTQLISERFGFYHAGIFLLDQAGEYAVLHAANSEGGLKMLRHNHRLKVGEVGIVGNVTQTGKARIALDVGQDAAYFDNPDLPNTRSEMALPLIVSGQVLGALDVQSVESQAFDKEDIDTLQILADQLAIAIENTRLFSESQQALDAARIAYGEVTREAWTKIIKNQPRIGYMAASTGLVQQLREAPTADILKTLESGDLITASDGLTIGIPVVVRGKTVGALRLKKSDKAEPWSDEETALAIALSEQLSGALESARLYNESQQRAAREALVSDISARISALPRMDTIMRETVQELGQTIGNASITFQLLEISDGQEQVGSPDNGSGEKSASGGNGKKKE